MTTPDFLQITSPHQPAYQSSQLPPGQGNRFSKGRTFPVDDETDVEENITRHTPSSPPRLFRKPSRRVADLRLPIEETQSIRPTRRPTIGLSRKRQQPAGCTVERDRSAFSTQGPVRSDVRDHVRYCSKPIDRCRNDFISLYKRLESLRRAPKPLSDDDCAWDPLLVPMAGSP